CSHGGDRHGHCARVPYSEIRIPTFDAATAVIAMDTALEYYADNTRSIRLIARPTDIHPPFASSFAPLSITPLQIPSSCCDTCPCFTHHTSPRELRRVPTNLQFSDILREAA